MKAVVFSFNPPSPDGSLANARTAEWVAAKLNIPLVCGPEIANETNLDVLFLVAGVFMYCRVLPQVAKAIEGAKRVVWIQNDYTIQPPLADGTAESPFRKAFRNRRMAGKPDVDFWTTMEKAGSKTDYSAYINWNAMAYAPQAELEPFSEREPAVIYYGADRDGRKVYFDRYFIGQAAPLVISSFSHSMRRYKNDAEVIQSWPRRGFYAGLGHFTMGLYLEDRKSHQEFTSPATRFYEMLSCGVAMVFQPEAVPMLYKAGYDVTPYVVQRPDALTDLLRSAKDIAAAQAATWATRPHLEQLESTVLSEYDRIMEAVACE